MDERQLPKLNTDKIEVLIFWSNTSPWSDTWWPVELGPPPALTNHACNLGIIQDSKLPIKNQVNTVSSDCYHTLRMLGKIFRWLPVNTRRSIMQALITSRLDYGNTFYIGITACFLKRLQPIQNSSNTHPQPLQKDPHHTPPQETTPSPDIEIC